MAAATTSIQQGYGTTVGSTATVTRHDFLSGDVSQATDQRSTYPITVPGSSSVYSYEVWHRLNVTDMGTSTQVYLIRHYAASYQPVTGITLRSSASTTTPSQITAATPKTVVSTDAVNNFPGASDPADDNIYGTLTATGQSGWVVSQAEVASTTTVGFTQNVTWKYAELA